MIKSVYFYETFRDSLRNFLRQKRIPQEEMIREIAENPESFVGFKYQPSGTNIDKCVMSLKGRVEDFAKLQCVCGSASFSLTMTTFIKSYMIKHKDDEPRPFTAKRKVVSVYFSPEEWDIVVKKMGQKTITEYIRGKLFDDQDE